MEPFLAVHLSGVIPGFILRRYDWICRLRRRPTSHSHGAKSISMLIGGVAVMFAHVQAAVAGTYALGRLKIRMGLLWLFVLRGTTPTSSHPCWPRLSTYE